MKKKSNLFSKSNREKHILKESNNQLLQRPNTNFELNNNISSSRDDLVFAENLKTIAFNLERINNVHKDHLRIPLSLSLIKKLYDEVFSNTIMTKLLSNFAFPTIEEKQQFFSNLYFFYLKYINNDEFIKDSLMHYNSLGIDVFSDAYLNALEEVRSFKITGLLKPTLTITDLLITSFLRLADGNWVRSLDDLMTINTHNLFTIQLLNKFQSFSYINENIFEGVKGELDSKEVLGSSAVDYKIDTGTTISNITNEDDLILVYLNEIDPNLDLTAKQAVVKMYYQLKPSFLDVANLIVINDSPESMNDTPEKILTYLAYLTLGLLKEDSFTKTSMQIIEDDYWYANNEDNSEALIPFFQQLSVIDQTKQDFINGVEEVIEPTIQALSTLTDGSSILESYKNKKIDKNSTPSNPLLQTYFNLRG